MKSFSIFSNRAVRTGWRPIVAVAFVFFVLRSAGCQFDITGNPDVKLLIVHVSPAIAVVPVNGRLVLTATITGSQQSSGITWTVIGSNNGRIDGNGLTATYYAPSAPATFPALPIEIRAVPDEDPTRYATCRVQLFTSQDTSFTISPDTVLLLTNQTQQFSIDTISPPISGIHWSLVSGPGSITENGLYSPPASVDSDRTIAIVRATSINNTAVFSTAMITLDSATDSLLCFTRDVLPVLSGSCGNSGCHDFGTHAAGYDFNTYSGTMASVKGTTARSTRLYNSIIQYDANSRMPKPPAPALTPNQVRIIGRWIDEGALDCQ
jgi:hypothetical protein